MTAEEMKAKITTLTQLETISNERFYYECVKERLSIHLVVYYNRLQDTLNALYRKVRKYDFVRTAEQINKELRKIKGTQYCYFKREEDN